MQAICLFHMILTTDKRYLPIQYSPIDVSIGSYAPVRYELNFCRFFF